MLLNAKAKRTAAPAPSEDRAVDLGRIEEKRIKASAKNKQAKKIDKIIHDHPNEALSVIRGWLHQDD